jgi:hypothetical protein
MLPLSRVIPSYSQHHPGPQDPTSLGEFLGAKELPIVTAPPPSASQDQPEKTGIHQISELLTRTRRVELENALANEVDGAVLLQSRMKKKQSRSLRGSAYRGVSKNGKKWQVQLLGNLRKHYIGSI